MLGSLMCGVAGYLSNYKLTEKKINLQNLVEDLKHRGPDGNGIFLSSDHKVALVHTRLAIIDLSNFAAQPMKSLDSKIVLSFNGEIYNYRELRKELETEGVKFQSASDTEVILELYKKYRELEDFETKFFNKLNGIFAFAIWDEDFGKMMITRDEMGVKPIYYQLKNNVFSFASEIKALKNFASTKSLNHSKNLFDDDYKKKIDTRLDLEALCKYITFLWCPGKSTPFLDIKKLGPGEFLTFGLDGSMIHKKWSNIKSKNTLFKQSQNFNYNKLTTTKLLQNAVKRQMISDVPVGAFLSGGLDSSAIVTFASKINPDLECFTIKAEGYEEEGFVDDHPFAVAVAKHLGVRLNSVRINPEDIISNLHKMVEILDEPLADPAALNIYFISEVARQSGIKVLLSGTGGDDVFSGYRRHLAVKYISFIHNIPVPFKYMISKSLKQFNSNKTITRRLKKLFGNLSNESSQFLTNSFKWIHSNQLEALYTSEFRYSLKNSSIDQPMLSFLEEVDNNLTDLQKCLAMERQFFLPDHNLIYTDKMSMAKGVEVRVPFLDKDLINFTSQLPDRLLIRGGKLKWILKKSMEAYLPKYIINRPKTGFGMPLRKWLKTELRDFVHDTLDEGVLIKRGLFDPQTVKNLIISNEKGKEDFSYTILSLLCIELWCQKFL